MNIDILILIHIFNCFVIVGLIWTIQIVHYPAFKYVESSMFKQFEQFHVKKITYLVGPLMLTELLTGIIILYLDRSSFWIYNFVGISILWIYTALVSVPIHNRLNEKKNEFYILKLVKTNWFRTILWTIRSLALCYYFYLSIKVH